MEKYYLTKISNLNNIRSHYFAVIMAVTAGLCSLFISQAVTMRLIFIAVVGITIDLLAFIHYNHLNNRIDKYSERLKNEF